MKQEEDSFIWEPYEGAEHKEKITITDFEMNPLDKYLNRKVLRGVNVKGLIKIVMEDNNENINSPDEYVIKFKGRMKAINNISEREKAIRDHYNEVSRNWMRKKREEKYKEEVAAYFPREDLSNRLNEEEIEGGTLKKIICDILSEKKELTQIQMFRVYHSPFWEKAIEEFMQTRDDFKKEGDKYVKKPK